jgi:hypothetical protein
VKIPVVSLRDASFLAAQREGGVSGGLDTVLLKEASSFTSHDKRGVWGLPWSFLV